MYRGGYEIIHIRASLHEVARSRVRVVMQNDQLADCTRKEKGAAGKPEGPSGVQICNNFVFSITRTFTVWYDAVAQESVRVSVRWLQSDFQKGLTNVFWDGVLIYSESKDTEDFRKDFGLNFQESFSYGDTGLQEEASKIFATLRPSVFLSWRHDAVGRSFIK